MKTVDCESFYHKEFKILLDVLILNVEDNLKVTKEQFYLFLMFLVEKIVLSLPVPYSEKQQELIQRELELLFHRCEDSEKFHEIFTASNGYYAFFDFLALRFVCILTLWLECIFRIFLALRFVRVLAL